jgi:hypothetical protein
MKSQKWTNTANTVVCTGILNATLFTTLALVNTNMLQTPTSIARIENAHR